MIFNPGDKVVCIQTDTLACPHCGDNTIDPRCTLAQPVVGRYYTVRYVGPGWCPTCLGVVDCLDLVESHSHEDWLYDARCFRKIEPGDSIESLLRQLDAPTPTQPKELEPA